ncbi:MAG: DNA topoisomerase I [Nanoarchaeota archaeon]|nr:DNA topoisomerase I [Nanoarchaeota archaeon]MBU1027564.1 DNA topoisomerase I [Nanoarchaeota archaeon]
MPRKLKKSKEEKLAESFFPVDQDDLKRTTEKSMKESISEKDLTKKAIEKKHTKLLGYDLENVKKIPRKRYKRKTKKTIDSKRYSPPKINYTDYELIITEKPQAAAKISEALGKSTRRDSGGVTYYELIKNGNRIIVACAVGHLFTLKQNNPGSEIPTFDISWTPNYLIKKNDFTKKYYNTLSALSKKANSFTVATDYDVEGEVIGFNIIRFICHKKDANRMKFSTLTEKELNQAYKNKSKNINWGQAIAGETRHYLDWFYGINLSRALMNSIKTTGSFRIMSIGRVQGPTLNLIVQKERKIQDFKSEPYWQVFITVKNGHILELKYNKDIFKKEELDKFQELKGKTAECSTIKTQETLPPNPPFNLTTLQTEAYKFYGITPSRTLQIAQSLYLAGLISYPRTSSQKLPSSINYLSILNKLAKEYKVSHLITKNKPIEGKKSDPAHPSIYPTGNKQILSGDDEKIYSLIIKRFLCLFCDSAIIENKRIIAKINELIFSTRGLEIIKKAWMEIYPSKLKEVKIPDLNGTMKIINTRFEEKQTQPPKRYSPASIISQLEKRNLGTKATRSSILETLYNRGYIQDTSIKATQLGMSLISTLEKYSSIIIDEKLTRSFEDSMESITTSTKNWLDKEKNIIEKAKKTIIGIAKDFEKNEKKIGKELLDANLKQREQQKKENTLIQCPICKKGNLGITYSKKTRRQFVACDAYPDCKTTFSLPPNGLIKKTEKVCEECNYPMLMRLSKGKRPWQFCFNPNCKTNKERLEEYRKKQEQEEK